MFQAFQMRRVQHGLPLPSLVLSVPGTSLCPVFSELVSNLLGLPMMVGRRRLTGVLHEQSLDLKQCSLDSQLPWSWLDGTSLLLIASLSNMESFFFFSLNVDTELWREISLAGSYSCWGRAEPTL